MNSAFRFGSIVIAIITVVSAGCATIVGDKTQLVAVSSTPDEAEIDIKDEKGISVFKGKTPSNVTLEWRDVHPVTQGCIQQPDGSSGSPCSGREWWDPSRVAA